MVDYSKSQSLVVEIPHSHVGGTDPSSLQSATSIGHQSVSPLGIQSVYPNGGPNASLLVSQSVHPVGTPSVHPAGTPSVHPVGTPSVHPVGTPSVHPVGTPSVYPNGTPSVSPITQAFNEISDCDKCNAFKNSAGTVEPCRDYLNIDGYCGNETIADAKNGNWLEAAKLAGNWVNCRQCRLPTNAPTLRPTGAPTSIPTITNAPTQIQHEPASPTIHPASEAACIRRDGSTFQGWG